MHEGAMSEHIVLIKSSNVSELESLTLCKNLCGGCAINVEWKLVFESELGEKVVVTLLSWVG